MLRIRGPLLVFLRADESAVASVSRHAHYLLIQLMGAWFASQAANASQCNHTERGLFAVHCSIRVEI